MFNACPAPTRLPSIPTLPSHVCPSCLQLDACDAQAQPAAALDPFAPAAIPGAQRGSGSRPASCRPSYSIPEDEREGLLELQPQDVSPPGLLRGRGGMLCSVGVVPRSNPTAASHLVALIVVLAVLSHLPLLI